MRTLAISSILLVLAIGMTVPTAFADHSEATVSMPEGSGLGDACTEGDLCFIPSDVTIDVGGEVTWVNDDIQLHNVHIGEFGGSGPEEFDSGLMMEGDTFSQKFETPGTYNYICYLHPWMMGMVTVVAEGEMMENGDDDGSMMRDDNKDDVMMDDPSAVMDGLSVGTRMVGGYLVDIWSGVPTDGEQLEIAVVIADGNTLQNAEHVNYDIVVTQNGEEVLADMGAHKHDGVGVHLTDRLTSGDPVDITVIMQGIGLPGEEKTGPIGAEAVYTGVVPEFGTIAMMVLAASIVSIIAVTAKSRVIPRL